MFNLRRLSELLRNLPPQKFDMKNWSHGIKCCDVHECGTKACIGGWSTLVFEDLKLTVTTIGHDHTSLTYTDPDGMHYDEYDAVATVWGISFQEAHDLCSPNIQYNAPTAAADQLDKLIEKYFIGTGDAGYHDVRHQN